jgi:hypothetical protein
MKLQRTYAYKGARHSFLSAGCPAPKGFKQAGFNLARASFAFDGGKKISATVNGSCKARGVRKRAASTPMKSGRC